MVTKTAFTEPPNRRAEAGHRASQNAAKSRLYAPARGVPLAGSEVATMTETEEL